ncbi:uncharacterized protein LY79DRAFT_553186 [Colletotrichum navitas]|uniref:Uncharacterized protein n=1 Tax=Colletotrichum navitas TaxID=681940 RepID=A0AAD8PZZ4_9PEZI|nr:uncharacterized protein LY79DRAFT_553186 [Colletotrichum navitas]KAK1593227.1 hypothetical protein LY79DRAFT_553186 [Colletotrichum navitas]
MTCHLLKEAKSFSTRLQAGGQARSSSTPYLGSLAAQEHRDYPKGAPARGYISYPAVVCFSDPSLKPTAPPPSRGGRAVGPGRSSGLVASRRGWAEGQGGLNYDARGTAHLSAACKGLTNAYRTCIKHRAEA